MAEWLKASALKAGFRETGTWVQILPSPLNRSVGPALFLNRPTENIEDVAEWLIASASKAEAWKQAAGSNPAIFVLLQIRIGKGTVWKTVGR